MRLRSPFRVALPVRLAFGLAALAAAATIFLPAGATHLTGSPATYTLDADFDEGTAINVVHSTPDQLQLDDTTTPFGFIWVAVSTKNTIVKIDTSTGAIVGEYWSAPQSSGLGDPSRTTVDKNGSVWVGNRNGGSVIHIGLEENGQCVDHNLNGIIDTSSAQNDIRPWPGAAATNATDECIIHYTQTAGSDVRHVSVDENNDVWVSGVNNRIFQLIDGDTGAILRTEGPVGYGGYGGLIDENGVIWSARPLLRWDTANPLSGPNGTNWTGYGHESYGLCIDSFGNVWNTGLGDGTIRKFNPAGALIGTFGQGNTWAQGCVVDQNDDVWVAHSLIGPQTTVGHLRNDGSYVGTVGVGSGPTGVAVDANGKIWATNYNSRTVSRIDPALSGGIGAVDFTTVDLGGNPYNYSDMTGSTLIGAPDSGTWAVVHDSGMPGAEWGNVSWNASEPGDSSITVSAASSNDGVTFGPAQAVTSGVDLTVANGQYLKVTVSFTRSSTGASPILYDLTIAIGQTAPSDLVLTVSPAVINENDTTILHGEFVDPDAGDTHTVVINWGDGSPSETQVLPPGILEFDASHQYLDDNPTGTSSDINPVNVTVTDSAGGSVSGSTTVQVDNLSPVITGFSGPAPTPIGSSATLVTNFTDVGTQDTHTCEVVNWDDGSPTTLGIVSEVGGSGYCKATHTYAAPGVYSVTVVITDDDGGVAKALYEFIVVYDPSVGFVTGGGSIQSAAGSYTADPAAYGRATFGFVSKYKKGAFVPTGETEFQLHFATFNFHSEAYSWLVVSGPRAQYKGTGAVNGVTGYSFLLSATDGQVAGGGGVDKFRIKIWETATGTVVYDNRLGSPDDLDAANPQAISGGSIVIHK